MSLPSPDTRVFSPEQHHQEVGAVVAKNLVQMGHGVLPDQVMATTEQTPIRQTPEMEEVGASIFSGDDLAVTIGRVFSHTGETRREAPTSMFSRILAGRLKGQKQ